MENNPWVKKLVEVLYKVCDNDIKCVRHEFYAIASQTNNPRIGYLIALGKLWTKKIVEHGIRPWTDSRKKG